MEPTLRLTANLHFEQSELPIAVAGALYSGDDRLLGALHDEPQKLGLKHFLYSGHRERYEAKHILAFWLTLTERHMDVIEELREKNTKGDVVLKMSLSAQFQTLKADLVDLADRVRHVQESTTRKGKRSSPATRFAAGPSDAGPRHSGPRVLSTDSYVLEQSWHHQDLAVVIKGSDWIHEYSEQLGRGRFLVVEVPDAGASGLPESLKVRFAKAAQSVLHARRELVSGEWSEVCEKLRPFHELLRSWPEFDSLIRAEYGEDAAESLSRAVNSFFDFSSKFIHAVARDRNTINPVEVARKEDAQLLYAVAASTLNAIGRKWSRLKRAPSPAS